MAQQPVSIVQPKYWGQQSHEKCVEAIDPKDSYLKLYKKQYRKSSKRKIASILNDFEEDEIKKDVDGNIIYPKHIDFRMKTMNVINPTLNDILFDDTLWSKHFRYKHKNKVYLEKSAFETFAMWYNNVMNNYQHQIPQKKQRNKICLVPITDDITYFIDEKLIKQLKELINIYFGLEIKDIDVSNTNNVLYRKNTNFNNFVTKDIHHKLSTYYSNDKDIFAIIGICSKIGLFSNDNKVIHGEHIDATQSAVCSFSKLGVYNKLERNIPEWLKIRRCGKILLHELASLFGLKHCEFFRCLMNKDVVLDCVPMHLCPVCLNKLYFAMIQENNHRNTFEYEIPIKQQQKEKEKKEQQQEAKQQQHQHQHQNQRKDTEEQGEGTPTHSHDDTIIIKGGTEEQKERKRKRRKKMKIDHEHTFNLLERYRSLAKWFNDHKLFREATWYKNRLKSLERTIVVNQENAV
mmetsp:Transcript_70351/g.63146  ORF Transcript_70351/g.63146 Transcript_70351/m.63146 type:complete len:461 (-) Transcript_70351:1406-2788(-)